MESNYTHLTNERRRNENLECSRMALSEVLYKNPRYDTSHSIKIATTFNYINTTVTLFKLFS